MKNKSFIWLALLGLILLLSSGCRTTILITEEYRDYPYYGDSGYLQLYVYIEDSYYRRNNPHVWITSRWYPPSGYSALGGARVTLKGSRGDIVGFTNSQGQVILYGVDYSYTHAVIRHSWLAYDYVIRI